MRTLDRVLKRDYEGVRLNHQPNDLKPYDDLTVEEKAKHEALWRESQAFFDKLGEAIRSGGPLPNPFERETPQ